MSNKNSNKEKKIKEIKEAQEKVLGKKNKKQNAAYSKKSEEKKKDKILEDLDLDVPIKISKEKKNTTYEIIEDLEEAITKEKISPQILHSEYTKELSHEPVQLLYDQMNNLKQSIEDKGYITQQEKKQVEYMVGAIEQKLEDQDAGKYSFTESVAMKASLVHKMGAMLKGMYKGNISKEDSRMYKTQ